MFIICPSCAGNGEGVFGHSWTDCPLCHGVGEVFRENQRVVVLSFEPSLVTHCRTPVRIAPRRKPVLASPLDPTEVFPEA